MDRENNSSHSYTNELIHESSPYLLQHAHNPVNWYPWGEAALEKAKKENKPLIISIGYSACHWCHVMEHESFEDTVVARIMNEHFVAIKVDREERPDVDQVYMDAVHLISGSGGWPLNAFALPDGKPFYAGTYFLKNDWIRVLEYFSKAYTDNPDALREQAQKVTDGIRSIDNFPPVENSTPSSMTELNDIFELLNTSLDLNMGGVNRAPKFPMPSVWEYLLHYSYLSGNQLALDAVTTTLDHMAMGGIYDQLGGGFARYSTDAEWLVPHFEKMLYDNAQLVSLYSHAWQRTGNPLYKETVYGTLEFVRRELTSDEGAFYSALDADSEGEEGKFYVWTKQEIEQVLGDNAKLISDYYNINSKGNWEEGKNILHREHNDEKIAGKLGMTVEELHTELLAARTVLLKTRDGRQRPGLDDKILTSWNALMLKGYVHAYRAFGESEFLEVALANAEFLISNAASGNNGITRNYKDGKSSIPGFLDDYAFLISALIELYQATFDEVWLHKARELTEYTLKHFYDPGSGMFFYTHDEHSGLIARKMEVSDNVIPASNSEMARNMFILGKYFYREDLIESASQMLDNVRKDIAENPFYYSNWATLQAHLVSQPFEVAILGEEYAEVRSDLDDHYLPNILLLGGDTEGSMELLKNKLLEQQTTIYVCQDKTCRLPVTTVDDALSQIRE